jgi:uncharacterized protein (DUF2252 family)
VHDLVRLALCLATAARGSDLPGVTTAHILENVIEGYAQGILHPHGHAAKKADATEPVKVVLREALKRKWHHLAQERIEDVKPEIPLGRCFWPPSKAETRELERLFETEEVRSKWNLSLATKRYMRRAFVRCCGQGTRPPAERDNAQILGGRAQAESIQSPGCAFMVLDKCCRSCCDP